MFLSSEPLFLMTSSTFAGPGSGFVGSGFFGSTSNGLVTTSFASTGA